MCYFYGRIQWEMNTFSSENSFLLHRVRLQNVYHITSANVKCLPSSHLV